MGVHENILSNILPSNHPLLDSLQQLMDEKGIIPYQYFQYIVTWEEVEKRNFNKIRAFIKELEKLGTSACQTLVIQFDGYNDVHDELWEIKEVRFWTAELLKRVPHLYYFLDQNLEADRIITVCLSNIHYALMTGEKLTPREYSQLGIWERPLYEIRFELTTPMVKRIENGLQSYCKRLNDEKGLQECLKIFNMGYMS